MERRSAARAAWPYGTASSAKEVLLRFERAGEMLPGAARGYRAADARGPAECALEYLGRGARVRLVVHRLLMRRARRTVAVRKPKAAVHTRVSYLLPFVAAATIVAA